MKPVTEVPDHVLREAAEWFSILAFGAASEEQRQSWRTWLGEEGSVQWQAWQQVERINQRFGAVAIDSAACNALVRQPRPMRRNVLCGIAVLGGALLLVRDGPHSTWWQDVRADQSSAVGEIKDLSLADGSRFWLNTDSAINLNMTQLPLSKVLLHRGEIHVQTRARDPGFLEVVCAHGNLQTRSSRFTVRQQAHATLVAVYDGEVLVSVGHEAKESRRILAGRQVRFSSERFYPEQTANPLHEGWARDQLIAVDMRLDALLEELARYRRGYLRCSEAVAGLRVVGVYPLRNTDQTLRALMNVLPIAVRQITPWWLSVEAVPEAVQV